MPASPAPPWRAAGRSSATNDADITEGPSPRQRRRKARRGNWRTGLDGHHSEGSSSVKTVYFSLCPRGFDAAGCG